MLNIKKEKGNLMVSVTENSFGYSIMLWKKGNTMNELCALQKKPKSMLENQAYLSEDRGIALADFMPVCQKISGPTVDEKSYETFVCAEPCDGAELSLVLQTTIGTMELKKRYPLSLERFVQETFGISNMWNPKKY